MGIVMVAWQLKNPRHVIFCYVPSCALWGIHYAMLGAPLGVLTNICSIFKDGTLAFGKDKYIPYAIYGYLFIIFTVGLYLFKGWYDIFPLLAGLVINISLLQRDNRALIARGTLCGQVCWFSYNIIVGAWVGCLCAVLVSASTVIGMARYEQWDLPMCYKRFLPSLYNSLIRSMIPRTYP